MRDEIMNEKRDFAFSINPPHAEGEEMYLHVRFYVKSGTNEERGRKVSGYLEIDGRRIRTWKNEDWVSISPLTLSDGDHTIRLVITDNQPAWVEIFEIAIINNNGTVLTELRELPENQK